MLVSANGPVRLLWLALRLRDLLSQLHPAFVSVVPFSVCVYVCVDVRLSWRRLAPKHTLYGPALVVLRSLWQFSVQM